MMRSRPIVVCALLTSYDLSVVGRPPSGQKSRKLVMLIHHTEVQTDLDRRIGKVLDQKRLATHKKAWLEIFGHTLRFLDASWYMMTELSDVQLGIVSRSEASSKLILLHETRISNRASHPKWSKPLSLFKFQSDSGSIPRRPWWGAWTPSMSTTWQFESAWHRIWIMQTLQSRRANVVIQLQNTHYWYTCCDNLNLACGVWIFAGIRTTMLRPEWRRLGVGCANSEQ